jgi:methionyl-tRNA formyltransferase
MSRSAGNRQLRVVLAGEESAGIKALKAVEASGSKVVAVMAALPEANRGRGELWAVAQRLGYDTWPAKAVKDPALADRIRSEEVDLLLNTHSLYLIHPEVLKSPRIGAFNLHPSPLPRYAGLNSVSWALYHGESTYGVTVHWMAAEIDAGHVAYQTIFPIGESDTAISLAHKCVEAGILLVRDLLQDASVSPAAIPVVQQDLSQRQYFGREVPNAGRLSWTQSARSIVNFARACDYSPYPSPWGHPKASIAGLEVEILKAGLTGRPCSETPGAVGEYNESSVNVAAADEWVCIKRVRIGKERVSPREVLESGARLETVSRGQ